MEKLARAWEPWQHNPGSVTAAWSPVAARVYGLKPDDFLDLTPQQLQSFDQDEPVPLF